MQRAPCMLNSCHRSYHASLSDYLCIVMHTAFTSCAHAVHHWRTCACSEAKPVYYLANSICKLHNYNCTQSTAMFCSCFEHTLSLLSMLGHTQPAMGTLASHEAMLHSHPDHSPSAWVWYNTFHFLLSKSINIGKFHCYHIDWFLLFTRTIELASYYT